MPLFFFHRTDGHVDIDSEGTEFENLSAARLQAIALAGASLSDNPEQVKPGEDFRVIVKNQEGRVVFTVLTTVSDDVQED